MSQDTRSARIFTEVHSDMWREGPGSDASTRRAAELARPHLPASPRILEVACGPGAQTVALLEAFPEATLLATDLTPRFLEQVRQRVAARGEAARVQVVQADMRTFSPGHPVDLIWCEGAAYIMGVPQALAHWKGLLDKGGVIAFTEAVWLTDAPSAVARANWAEYPQMQGVEGCLALVREQGYEVVGSFVLPASDWQSYYGPMQQRLDQLRECYAEDAEALAELAAHQSEIDAYAACGEEFGYLFVVATG